MTELVDEMDDVLDDDVMSEVADDDTDAEDEDSANADDAVEIDA